MVGIKASTVHNTHLFLVERHQSHDIQHHLHKHRVLFHRRLEPICNLTLMIIEKKSFLTVGSFGQKMCMTRKKKKKKKKDRVERQKKKYVTIIIIIIISPHLLIPGQLDPAGQERSAEQLPRKGLVCGSQLLARGER